MPDFTYQLYSRRIWGWRMYEDGTIIDCDEGYPTQALAEFTAVALKAALEHAADDGEGRNHHEPS